MLGKKSIRSLRAEHESVLQQIADSPLSQPRFVEALAFIEAHDGQEPAEINAGLVQADLPDLAEVGMVQAKNLLKFGRLNRRRVKLEEKLKNDQS